MSAFLPDTSCLVACLCAWHEHHARALRALEERLAAGQRLVLAAPALIETYAVLTRLPAPHRLAPAVARDLLTLNFGADAATIVALSAADYWTLLQTAPERDIAGGRTYDAVIAACALAAEVSVILTFNARHFQPLVSPTIEVIVP